MPCRSPYTPRGNVRRTAITGHSLRSNFSPNHVFISTTGARYTCTYPQALPSCSRVQTQCTQLVNPMIECCSSQCQSAGKEDVTLGSGYQRLQSTPNSVRLRSFTPAGKSPGRGPLTRAIGVVLMFHGGGFGFGQDSDVPAPEVDYLNEKGVVVVSAQYRLAPQSVRSFAREDHN